MCALNRDEAIVKLRALRDRLDRKAVHQPEFGIVRNDGKPGQQIFCSTVSVPGQPNQQQDALREFFALARQIRRLLIDLGVDIGDGVFDWALELVGESVTVPRSKGEAGVDEVTVPGDHPYRVLAMAIDVAFPQHPPKGGPPNPPGRPSKAELHERIRTLYTEHKLWNEWANLARIASADEEARRLNGGEGISRDMARNAVKGDRKSGGKPQ